MTLCLRGLLLRGVVWVNMNVPCGVSFGPGPVVALGKSCTLWHIQLRALFRDPLVSVEAVRARSRLFCLVPDKAKQALHGFIVS